MDTGTPGESGPEGRWRVKREAGLLPPGLRKTVSRGKGWTWLGPLPLAPFRVVGGATLRYRLWPLRDELVQEEDGTWHGTGYLFGVPFCRFRLEPRPGRGALPAQARAHSVPEDWRAARPGELRDRGSSVRTQRPWDLHPQAAEQPS